MSYLPPPILLREHSSFGLRPERALALAERAWQEGRIHDAERLVEIAYDLFDDLTGATAQSHH